MVIAEQKRTDRPGRDRGHRAANIRPPLARVLSGRTPSPGTRGEIVDSWRQSAALGLTPDHVKPPFDADELDPRLMQAATPVLDRLGHDLATTQISVVLAGERCRVLDHRAASPLEEAQLNELMLSRGYLWGIDHVGTNGLSAAMATRRPVLVHGDEHFADALRHMATAGAPIVDPHTARVVGVLAFVCLAEVANQLLLPMVSRAAQEIEHGLLNDFSGLDRLVQAKFLDARRRTRSPLAAVSRTTLLANAAAAPRLRAEDRGQIWGFVSHQLSAPNSVKTRLRLSDGSTVNVSLEAIVDGNEVAGALIRFAASTAEVPLPSRSRAATPFRSSLGWDSLTDAEHAVTELVAEGLTNREVAAALFLSPHTVDSHLRHIFRKLDINSRVDVVRMVTARSFARRSLVGATDVA